MVGQVGIELTMVVRRFRFVVKFVADKFKNRSTAALAEILDLPENVKPYSIVGVGYPAEDADLEAVDRFDAGRIHYNKY